MRRARPDAEQLTAVRPLPAEPQQLIDALTPLVGAERLARIETVVAARTRDVALVLEAVDDPRNVSAILRSADAFGVQEVHLVQGEHPFLASKLVTQGAERWLDVIVHPDVNAAISRLRSRGFRICAATMQGDEHPEALATIPKIAVVFGNEHAGLSPGLLAACDGRYTIPMRGFSQSLNVSVAAAITLHAATTRRGGTLTTAERDLLRARFLMLSVPRADEVVAELIGRRS